MNLRRGVGLFLGLVIAAASLVALAVPASAGCPRLEDFSSGSESSAGCTDEVASSSEGETATSGNVVWQDDGPYTVYNYEPGCSVNNETENSPDVLCNQFTACPTEGERRWQVYTQEVNPPEDTVNEDDWEFQGTQCRGDDELDEGGAPQITEQMIIEIAQATAPPATVGAEPGATSYVNIPNNFYATSGATTETVTLIGTPVTLEYTPTSYSWKFGDGNSGTGPGVKNASLGQAGAVEHEYRRQGDYAVTVTTSFEVRASVAGGQSITLSVPVTSTSEPHNLDVGEIQSTVTRVR